MKRTGIILFLAAPFFSSLFAQEKVDAALNMFRANDTIVKRQVEYKDPGRAGESVLWDFGKLKPVNNRYTVLYSQTGDTDSLLAGTEHQTRYYYALQNDGYENPTTRISYETPELLLRFPMQYSDKAEGYYQGRGIYCDKLDIEAYGSYQTAADAYGMLILPGGDTLRHVLRVKTEKLVSENILPVTDSLRIARTEVDSLQTARIAQQESIRYRLERDSAVTRVDTYRWYAAGYRYPVFETVRTGNARDDGKTDYFATAFYFPPEEHTYLQRDEKNRQVRDSLLLVDKAAEEKARNGDNDTKSNRLENGITVTYNFFPNPVESQLALEIYISEEANVSYGLYSITGALVYQKRARLLPAGTHSERIDMGHCLRGEYILQLQVNEKKYSEKILKK